MFPNSIIYDYQLHKDYEGKALHGDIVVFNEEKKSVTVVLRDTHKIVGTLLLNSKVKYGIYKDKILYLFKPSVPNYPDFYVASKYENETENKYVYIEFAEWNTYLRGNVIDYIGNVGEKEAEYAHLKYINELNGIKELKLLKDKIKSDYEKNEKFQEECKLKNSESYYQLFSIDPYGCKDIDDAFHFKVLDKSKELYEVGVHISYTWEYFKEDIEKYFKIFSERISTFYGYNKNINMIPKEYSEDLCSLIEKNYRHVLSIIFTIENNIIMNSNIGLNVGYIVRNYSYDTVNDLYKEYSENNIMKVTAKQDKLIKFMEVSKRLFKTDLVEDSHKLVEYWMVYSNCIMANECVKKFGSNVILRVQDKSIIANNNSNLEEVGEEDNDDLRCNLLDSSSPKRVDDSLLHSAPSYSSDRKGATSDELNQFLKIYNGEAALYKLYNSENNEDNYHQNIVDFIKEKHYYTHYTSPIRRFCDMYIHGLYIGILPKSISSDYLNLLYISKQMNDLNKKMRKYQNQSKILDLLFKYIDKEEYIIDTNGYIIEIDGEKNNMKVYFPEFGFILKRRIIDAKFKSIAEININKVGGEDNKYIVKIENINKVEEKEYTLFKKYDLKIYLFPKKYVLQDRMIFIFNF